MHSAHSLLSFPLLITVFDYQLLLPLFIIIIIIVANIVVVVILIIVTILLRWEKHLIYLQREIVSAAKMTQRVKVRGSRGG